MPISSLLISFLACCIITVGATLHGVVGLGMGLFSAPLLLLINPKYVPGPLLVCVLLLTILMAFREKQSIDFYGLGWGYTGRIIGTILAVTILSYISQKWISILSAGLVLVAVVLSIIKIRAKHSIASLVTAGSASGIMSTLSSVGGPPFALLYQYEKGSKLRATMSSFFILGTITSIISLVLVGEFSFSHIKSSIPLIPGVLFGYYFSTFAINILNQRKTRAAVLVVSAISSLIVIARFL